jgi:hypothetical protein
MKYVTWNGSRGRVGDLLGRLAWDISRCRPAQAQGSDLRSLLPLMAIFLRHSLPSALNHNDRSMCRDTDISIGRLPMTDPNRLPLNFRAHLIPAISTAKAKLPHLRPSMTNSSTRVVSSLDRSTDTDMDTLILASPVPVPVADTRLSSPNKILLRLGDTGTVKMVHKTMAASRPPHMRMEADQWDGRALELVAPRNSRLDRQRIKVGAMIVVMVDHMNSSLIKMQGIPINHPRIMMDHKVVILGDISSSAC